MKCNNIVNTDKTFEDLSANKVDVSKLNFQLMIKKAIKITSAT